MPRKKMMKAKVAPMAKSATAPKRMMCQQGEPRNTIPKMRDNSSGRMFHETIHLGGVPGVSGSPYDGRKAVSVRPVGRMQAPELQSGRNPMAIRTSGMESGT